MFRITRGRTSLGVGQERDADGLLGDDDERVVSRADLLALRDRPRSGRSGRSTSVPSSSAPIIASAMGMAFIACSRISGVGG